MKKLFKISACIVAFLLFLFIVSCDNHKHTYEDKYTYNTTEHWHNANCGHDDISGKEAHAFSDWKVITAATEDKYGKEERTCSVCGYKETRSIERLAHTHTYDETTYSYDEEGHWHPATCSHKDQYTKEAHTFGDWTTVIENGYNIKGKKTRTCSVCSYVEEQEIPARNYYTDSELCELAKSYFNSVKGTITIDTEYNTTTTHVVLTANGGKAKITEGNNEFYLAINAETLKQYVARNGYYGDVLPVLVFDGRIGTLLNYLESSSYDVSGSIGEAAFSFTYNADSDSYQITRKDEIITIDEFLADNSNELDHLKAIFDISQNVKLEDGKLIISSNYQDKGYKSTLTVEKNNPEVNIPEHTHIYEEAWTDGNDEGHYHAPICPDGEAKYQLEHHTYGEVIVDTPRTNDEDGLGHKICTKCGHEEQVIITALGHVHNFGEWVLKKPTQTETGTYTRTCTLNENHIDKIDLPSIADENVTSTQTEGKWLLEYVHETCTTAGKKTYTYVGKGSESGEEVTVKFEVVIDALGHDYIYEYTYDEVNGKATKTTTCSRCDHHEEEAVAKFDANEPKNEVLVIGIYNSGFFGDSLTPQGSSALVVTGLPTTNKTFTDFDELVVVGNYKDGHALKVIKLIKVNHPSYTITLQGDSTINIDINDKYENASSVTFTLTPSQGKAITNVVIKDSSNNELTHELNNDSYTFTMCGDVTIEVEETDCFVELTDLSTFDVENRKYKVLIADSVITDGKTYILDGNKGEDSSTAVIGSVFVSDGMILGTSIIEKSYFTFYKFEDTYLILSNKGLFVGRTESTTGLEYSYLPIACSLSMENNKTFVKSNNISLQFNNGTTKYFRFYTSNQSAIKLYVQDLGEYTTEEKTAIKNNILNVESNIFETSKVYSNITTIDFSKYYDVDITVKSQTVDDTVKLAEKVLTIAPNVSTENINVVLTLTFKGQTKDVNIEVEKTTGKSVSEALQHIDDNLTGENKPTETTDLYEVTGRVKEKTSSLVIEDLNDNSKTIVVFGMSGTRYVGDTITVIGKLANYGANEGNSYAGTKEIKDAELKSRVPGTATINLTIDANVVIKDKNGNAITSSSVEGSNGTSFEFTLVPNENASISTITYGGNTITLKADNKYSVKFDNEKELVVTAIEKVAYDGYEKVLNAEDLHDGDKIVFASSAGYTNVSRTGSNGYFDAKKSLYSNTVIGSVLPITLEKVTDTTWKLKVTLDAKDYYIQGPESQSKSGTISFVATDSVDENTQRLVWTLTSDMVFTCSDGTKTHIIQYDTNKISAWYGGKTPVGIYKYTNYISKSALEGYAEAVLAEEKAKIADKEFSIATDVEFDSNISISITSVKRNNVDVENLVSFANHILSASKNTDSEYDVIVTVTMSVDITYDTNKHMIKPDQTLTVSFKLSKNKVASNTDVITKAFTGNPSSYTNWSDKTGESTAVYAGNSTSNGDNIQMNSTKPSGIVVTSAPSNKVVDKITIVWASNTTNGRTIDVYGKATAYTESSDLYGNNDTKGTKLGSIVYGTSTELTISGNYSFIGIRSNSNALYVASITITWKDAPAN